MKLFYLMLAGALGAAARYGLTLVIQNWLIARGQRGFLATNFGATFPLGTLIINVCGCFLLAFLTTLVLQGTVKPEWRLILGTGFLGAFTTFSTFEVEADSLLSSHQWLPASIYIFGNLLLGFVAVVLGRLIALRFFGAATEIA